MMVEVTKELKNRSWGMYAIQTARDNDATTSAVLVLPYFPGVSWENTLLKLPRGNRHVSLRWLPCEQLSPFSAWLGLGLGLRLRLGLGLGLGLGAFRAIG